MRLTWIFFALVAFVACGGGASEDSGGEETRPETRTVEHALGATEVPVEPERIVSLSVGEITDTLIALDNKPVGSVTYDPVADAYGGEEGNGAYPPALTGKTEGIEPVGVYEPNIEKVAALEPDLIIGETWSVEPIQDQLSEIAPTVAISPERDFKVWVREIGAAIGAEEKSREVLDEYEEHSEAVKREVEGTPVSVVRPRTGEILLYGPPSNAGVVLKDLGLEIQPVPEDAEDWSGDGTRAIGSLSLEFVPSLSGEHIFVITYDLEDTTFEELIERPIWQQLEAVREGRIHPVQGVAWTNHGPIGANLIIDEVEEAIVGSS